MRARSATTAPRVLHLEDDWLALEPIGPDRIEPLFEADVGAMTFLSINKHTRRLPHQISRRVVKKGRRIGKDFLVNGFSTSPGVCDCDFLREARAAQGLVKLNENGASVWRQAVAAPEEAPEDQAD